MQSNLVGPVADALEGLTARDKQILAAVFVEGLNATEIGKRLKMKPTAVRQQRKRLLERLAGNDDLKAIHSAREGDLEPFLDDARDYPYRESKIQ